MSKKEVEERLEEIIDAGSLGAVIASLADICDEKADHIESSYDDEETAGMWRDAAEDLRELDIEV